MESIVTLIVIIVVFNLINSLFRAIRGDRPGQRKTVPVRSDPSFESFEESTAVSRQDKTTYYYSAFPDDNDYLKDNEQRPDEKAEEIAEEFGKIKRRAVSLKRDTICQTAGISSGLNRALTQKDSLVSAFIFHEIFKPPPGLRQKR